MVDISGWQVVGWRYAGPGMWTCALVMPNGSRYEPSVVGGALISKAYNQSFFTVRGFSESDAKENLRKFMEGVQRDRELKSKEPQDFSFDEGYVKPKQPDIHERMEALQEKLRVDMNKIRVDELLPPPDTSWVKTEDISKSGREPQKKSLWAEWKEKRARKNQGVEASSREVEDNSGSAGSTED